MLSILRTLVSLSVAGYARRVSTVEDWASHNVVPNSKLTVVDEKPGMLNLMDALQYSSFSKEVAEGADTRAAIAMITMMVGQTLQNQWTRIAGDQRASVEIASPMKPFAGGLDSYKSLQSLSLALRPAVSVAASIVGGNSAHVHSRAASAQANIGHPVDLDSSLLKRRSLLGGVGILSILDVSSPNPSLAANEVSTVVPKSKAVVVLGANGGTGMECIRSCTKAGRKCIATSRSGDIKYEIREDERESITTGQVDVTSLASINSFIRSSDADIGAIIFAASASTKGGDAKEVDKNGVVNVAKACIENKIQRLVIVSSGTVTRPDSAVYQLLNFVGKGIMEAKIQGEDMVREMYAKPEVFSKGLGYTIVRPGGLTVGDSVGVASLELNQGDNKSGRLPRADVAEISVNCLDHASTFDTTFECYEANTAKPVESVGLSNIMKSTDATTFLSGRERRGKSWVAIFDGLQSDVKV